MLIKRVDDIRNARMELDFEKKLSNEMKKILQIKGTELEVAVAREYFVFQGSGKGCPAAPQGPQDCKPSTLNFHILPLV